MTLNPMLDSEAITQIREYVCDECDLVRSVVGKLNNSNPDTKYRYIRLMIFNIVEFCVNLLDENDGWQML